LEKLAILLGFIGIGSACVPALILLISTLKRKKIQGFNLFKILAIEYFIVNVTTLFIYFPKLESFQKYIFSFHYLFELIAFTLFFLKFSDFKKVKFVVVLAMFLLGIFLFLFYFQGVIVIDNYLAVSTNICLVTFSIYYIFGMYQRNLSTNLFHVGVFWIVSVVLFYNAIQFYFSFYEIFIRNEAGSIFYFLWPIFQVSGIIYYSIFSLGLWKLERE
jgi:hypothetical protein